MREVPRRLNVKGFPYKQITMKKLLLIVTILFAGIATSSAQENEGKAEFKFNKEIIDFGELTQGDTVTHEFTFKNIGKQPLVIASLVPGCDGCIITNWSKEPIKPGENSVIKVSYITSGRTGPFSKNIIIFSNAKTPQKVIYIKGKVQPLLN